MSGHDMFDFSTWEPVVELPPPVSQNPRMSIALLAGLAPPSSSPVLQAPVPEAPLLSPFGSVGLQTPVPQAPPLWPSMPAPHSPFVPPSMPFLPSSPVLPSPSRPHLSATPPFYMMQPPTHAARNPKLPVQPSRKLGALSEAQKASLKLRRELEEEEHARMNMEFDALLLRHCMELEALAARYGKKVDYLDKLKGTSNHYKAKRAVNIENAKLHAKAIEINAGK